MRCDCASVKGCWMWADALNFSSVLLYLTFPFSLILVNLSNTPEKHKAAETKASEKTAKSSQAKTPAMCEYVGI